jgi:hypothetical protein
MEDVDSLRFSTEQIAFAGDSPDIDPLVVPPRDKTECCAIIESNGCQAGNPCLRRLTLKLMLLMRLRR